MGFSSSAPQETSQVQKTTPVQASAPVAKGNKDDIIAVIAAALAAGGDEVVAVIAAAMTVCTEEEYIAQINRLGSNKSWINYAKMESATVRNQMF